MERVLKFAVVGTIGFIINTTLLILGVKAGLRPSIAAPLGAEIAIISNFLLNNFWTFSDKSIISWSTLPWKFIQFNLFSIGTTFLQFAFLRVGESIFGLEEFKKPLLKRKFFASLPIFPKLPFAHRISVYLIVYLGAVGCAMVINFFIYSLVIWK